jgi:hypothetical protein
MTERIDDPGCGPLQKAYNDKNVKIEFAHTGVKSGAKSGEKSSAYFVEILSSLKVTDPRAYFGTTKSTWIAIDNAIQDDEDGLVWDWYVLYCPTGPPCLFLENLTMAK